MFSAMQPIPELENKSLQIRELFAKTANEKLAKGLTESEAIFSALQVVSSYERANRPKPVKNQIAPHLKAILDAAIAKKYLGSQESTEPAKTPINASQQYSKFIKKNTLSPDSERSLISASWTDDARLVLEFDDGEKITTDAAPVAEVIQNIAVGVNQTDKQEVYIGVPTILPLHPALVFEQVVIEGQTVYRMKVSDGNI